MTNVRFLSDAQVTTTAPIMGGSYLGIWWDSLTLPSHSLSGVTIRTTGVSPSHPASLSASVYWNNVDFSNSIVSDLIIETTSPTEASHGSVIGIFFSNVDYQSSRLEDVTITSSGVKVNSASGNGWGFRSDSEVSTDTQFTGWTVKLSGVLNCSGDCAGLRWYDVESSRVKFTNYQIVVDNEVRAASDGHGVIIERWQDVSSVFDNFDILIKGDVIGGKEVKGVMLTEFTWSKTVVNGFVVNILAKVAAPNDGNQSPFAYTTAYGIEWVFFSFFLLL